MILVETDYVPDTPTQLEANSGIPTFPHITCGNAPNGDMFVNYMDYTDDGGYSMFSLDQKDRMWAVMNSGNFRIPLKTSPTCNLTVPAPVANFIDSNKTQVLCTSKTIRFKDKSLFTATTPASVTYSWSFPGGTPSTGTGKFVDVTYTTGGLKSVTLTVTNSRGTNTITKQVAVAISAPGTFPLVEDFEGPFFPPAGWETINRNGNQNINWDYINGYSAYGNGLRCMKFDNTTLDAGFKRDDIMTSKLDLTGITDAKVKFDISHAPYYNATGVGVGIQLPNPKWIWDTLEVLITDNCQLTTQSIYKKGDSALATVMPGQGEEFYPAANQWRTDSVVIPAAYLNKPNVQIIFRNYGGYGHTVYIDNINVKSNVAPPATANFTMSDTVVCVGSSLTFTNTSTASTGTPDSVRWTINGGTPSTSTSTTTVTSTFSTAGTYNISLIAYKGGTASTPAVKSIRVRSKTTPTFTQLGAYCVGATAGALPTTSTNGVTGTWNPSTISTTNAGTTVYTFTPTAGLCANTTTMSVVVNSATTPTFTQLGAYCVGATAGALPTTSTNGVTGTWNPSTISTASAGTTVYTFTPTAGLCATTTTMSVVVNAKTTPTFTQLGAYCVGATAGALPTTSTNGVTGTWNPSTISTTNAGTTVYTFTPTAGLCANGTSMSVVVNAKTTPTFTQLGAYCVGATAGALPTTSTNGVTGTWNPSTVSTASAGTTVYTFTPTAGLCANTATMSVVVNSNATINLTTANSSQTVCAGVGITNISYNVGGGATGAGVTGLPTGINGTYSSGVFTISGSSSSTGTFNYTVTTTGSCTQTTATGSITINSCGCASPPSVSLSSPSGSTCVSTAKTITGNTFGGSATSVSLSENGAGSLNITSANSSPFAFTYTPAAGDAGNTVTITVTTNNPNGSPCVAATTNYILTVNASTTPTFTQLGAYCVGATAAALPTTSNNGVTGTWNPSTISTANAGTTVYTFTPTTGLCATTTTMSVVVNSATTPTFTQLGAYCVGATAAALPTTSNNGVTGTWNPSTISTANAGTTVYTFTPTAGLCATTTTMSVVVNTTPATPTITQSNDTLYSSTVVSGATYNWYKDGSTTPIVTIVPSLKITVTGIYTVEVVSNGCASIKSATFNGVTSFRNTTNSIKVFEIYPNPTEGNITLNISLTKQSNVKMQLFNPEGREMFNNELGLVRDVRETMNISNFAKGMYILKLQVDDEVHYHKVVRQ
jgi:hypothetical protein